MILHNYECIFLHIPRTGGTSIEHAFGIDMWKQAPYEKHLSASEARKKYGDKIWNKYFKFTIVRNPYDRAISMWKTKYYGNFKTFYDFLLFFRPKLHESNKGKFKYVDLLDEQIDFIGKYENIHRDIDKIGKKIGKEIELPHSEKTDREHYSKYYDVRTKIITEFIFNRDIIKFGYKFENLHKRNLYKSNIKILKFLYILKYKFDLFRIKIGLLTFR